MALRRLASLAPRLLQQSMPEFSAPFALQAYKHTIGQSLLGMNNDHCTQMSHASPFRSEFCSS